MNPKPSFNIPVPSMFSKDLSKRIDKNLNIFATNFESFRTKNEEYLKQIRKEEKPFSDVLIKKDQNPSIEKKSHEAYQIAKLQENPSHFGLKGTPNGLDKNLTSFSNQKVESIQNDVQFHMSNQQEKPLINNQNIVQESSQKVFSQFKSENTDFRVLFKNEQIHFKSHCSKNIEPLFQKYDLDYKSQNIVPKTEDFLKFNDLDFRKKYKIFIELGEIASIITNHQIESLLTFVSAFESNFLTLHVVEIILKKTCVQLSEKSIEIILQTILEIKNSRRVNLLLINFINKLN